MHAKVDVGGANGGEFAEVSRLEIFKGEEAAELVRPELARVEQLVKRPRLEISAQEEVTEVTGELVRPEGI